MYQYCVSPHEIHLKPPWDFAPATFLCTFSIQAAVEVLQLIHLSSKCHCITHSHTTSRMKYTVNPFGTTPPKFEEQPYTKHYQAHVCLHVEMYLHSAFKPVSKLCTQIVVTKTVAYQLLQLLDPLFPLLLTHCSIILVIRLFIWG